MNTSDITNPLFREAVTAIDSGNIILLERLMKQHPQLVNERANTPEDGYFAHPYLLWFVADNPIRHKKLPATIAGITSLLIKYIKEHSPENYQQQIDSTLGLVVTGHTPRNSGVQIPLMDVLIDAGAAVGNGHGALANNNIAAAQHLLKRGGQLTLATAVCLDKKSDIERLATTATETDLAIALVAAAFYGKAERVQQLLGLGANPNAWLDASSGFHWHATALHQAVSSGSLECVQLLVAADADVLAKDRIYQGTPLGWVQHMLSEEMNEDRKKTMPLLELICGAKNIKTSVGTAGQTACGIGK